MKWSNIRLLRQPFRYRPLLYLCQKTSRGAASIYFHFKTAIARYQILNTVLPKDALSLLHRSGERANDIGHGDLISVMAGSNYFVSC